MGTITGSVISMMIHNLNRAATTYIVGESILHYYYEGNEKGI